MFKRILICLLGAQGKRHVIREKNIKAILAQLGE